MVAITIRLADHFCLAVAKCNADWQCHSVDVSDSVTNVHAIAEPNPNAHENANTVSNSVWVSEATCHG